MQLKVLALFGVMATASLQSSGSSSELSSSGSSLGSSSAAIESIFSVLSTAVPSSLLAEALSDSVGVVSLIASEFSAGETPTWWTGLPIAVKTYLLNAPLVSSTTTSTAFVPLTTIFTPPDRCSSILYTWVDYVVESGVSVYARGTSSLKMSIPSSIATCWPSGWRPNHQVFSPGVCPSGYVAVSSSTSGGHSHEAHWSFCCPSGMSLKGHCETFVTDPILVALNASINTTTSNIVLQDRSIVVVWQSSDLNRFTPNSAPVLTSTFAATTTNTLGSGKTTPVATSTKPRPHANNASNDLSTGAKAGNGVGVALACLIIATVIVASFRKRRRDTTPEFARRSGAEAEGTPVVETHAHSRPAEADSVPRAELMGGWHGHEVHEDPPQ